MIEPHWNRISAFHLEDNGTLGAVWLAHDIVTSVVHLYDAALFTKEVPAVIVSGLAARGRHYPLAWRKQDEAMAMELQDAGLNVLPEPCVDNPAMVEVRTRVIEQMLRTNRFRVDVTVGEWFEEYRKFFNTDSGVPHKGFPLMSATRHAVEMLPYARPAAPVRREAKNYPKVAIV